MFEETDERQNISACVQVLAGLRFEKDLIRHRRKAVKNLTKRFLKPQSDQVLQHDGREQHQKINQFHQRHPQQS